MKFTFSSALLSILKLPETATFMHASQHQFISFLRSMLRKEENSLPSRFHLYSTKINDHLNVTIISYLPFIKHIMDSSQDIIQLFNQYLKKNYKKFRFLFKSSTVLFYFPFRYDYSVSQFVYLLLPVINHMRRAYFPSRYKRN